MVLRITTWNVNGIRNPFSYQPWRDKRTFDGMFDILEADIVVMQELKIQRKDLRDDMVMVPGWDCYFSLPRHKKGYSGVGIYTRNSKCAPIRAEEGVLGVLCPPGSSIPYCEMPAEEHIGGYLSDDQLEHLGVDAAALDAEGRCMAVEFPAFVLLGIYSPANSSGTRDDFRYGFINALDMRIRNLVASGKRVVVTGDLNVSREKIDTANAEDAMRKEGITHDDYISTPNRRIFNQLLEGGLVVGERDEGREKPVLWDICRGFHPIRTRMFTHWEQKINARPGNFGSRIDFVLCSLDMKSWFCESNIQEGLMGSDHCPVYAVIKDEVDVKDQTFKIEDVMAAAGTFENGVRLKEWSLKDAPAISAKLMPEFDKRRSIKAMFGSKPSLKPNESSEVTQVSQEGIPVAAQLTGPVGPLVGAASGESQENGINVPQTPPPSTHESTSTTNILHSGEKKRSPAEQSSTRPLKRSRSGVVAPTNSGPLKGQQSLKGFFKSNPSPTKSSKNSQPEEKEQNPVPLVDNTVAKEALGKEARAVSDVNEEDESEYMSNISVDFDIPPKDTSLPPIEEQEEVFDPIVSKESWSKLFTKPRTPRCEGHGEPCQLMKTKKPGINCGREFWMCSRPLGPSGTKERNSQWRCPTFIWCSERNGTTETDT